MRHPQLVTLLLGSAVFVSSANASAAPLSDTEVLEKVQLCLQATETEQFNLAPLMPNASAADIASASKKAGLQYYHPGSDPRIVVMVSGPIAKNVFCTVHAQTDGSIGRNVLAVMKRSFGSDPVETPLGTLTYPAWKVAGREIYVRVETPYSLIVEVFVRHSSGKAQ